MKLRCRCGGPTRVLETRKQPGDAVVIRLCLCLDCGHRFNTAGIMRDLDYAKGLAVGHGLDPRGM